MSDELCQMLGYSFSDKKLLKIALTHRSFGEENNERYEFLGDSIVNFVIAEALFEKYPTAQEGQLSRWRATLINRDTLAHLAKQFNMGRFLLLGAGELKSGGNERNSILSCAMEAVIGAIYLDGGFEKVRACILSWYETLFATLLMTIDHKDPKTRLQEYLQTHHLALPTYTIEAVEGESHQQTFSVSCWVADLNKKTLGQGTSRRRAEQAAAECMLGIIHE